MMDLPRIRVDVITTTSVVPLACVSFFQIHILAQRTAHAVKSSLD